MTSMVEKFLAELSTGIQRKAQALSHGDVHLQEDLQSEAVVACLRVLDRYSDRPPTEQVLLAGRSAVNAMNEHLRWVIDRKSTQEGDEDEAPSFDREVQDTVSSEAISRELLLLLQSALSRAARSVLDKSVRLDETGVHPVEWTARDLAQSLQMPPSSVIAARIEMQHHARAVFGLESNSLPDPEDAGR
jgi:hypothetical protein